MEGVAYAFADCQRVLADAGTDFAAALAVGGGARSETWLRIIASVLDRPLELAADSDVGAALGAARLAICAAEGADPGRGLRRAGDPARSIEPDPAPASPPLPRGLRPLPRPLSRRSKESHAPMSDFFKGIDPVPFKGPDSDDPLAFRFYEPDRHRARQARWTTTCAWRSPTGTPSPGRAATRSAARPSSGRGSASGMAARRAQGRGRLRDVHDPRRDVLHLPRPRRRARGQEPRRVEPQRPRRSPTSSPARWRRPASSCSGAPPTCSRNRRYMAGAATNPDPDVFAYAAAQVKAAIDVTHDARAAPTTCSGAAARATRPCSTPT